MRSRRCVISAVERGFTSTPPGSLPDIIFVYLSLGISAGQCSRVDGTWCQCLTKSDTMTVTHQDRARHAYMRLFFHFANLHDGRNGKHLFFRKRYDDICTEWLGGLTDPKTQHRPILKHNIVGEQLGQHIGQLVAAGFLASYTVKKAENRDGFVIVFRPSVGFFEDYERFYRRRHQGELQWAFHEDRRQISEPLKVAYLFTEKRTGYP